MKTMNPVEIVRCKVDAVGTKFLARDWQMMAIYGKANEVTDENGLVWKGRRILDENIQTLLNAIGSDPGMMLVRIADRWDVLSLGAPGQVLTVDGTLGLPDWQDPQDPSAGLMSHVLCPIVTANFTQNVVTIGNILRPKIDMAVTGIGCSMTTVTGAVYKPGIALYDTSAQKLLAPLTYCNPYTEASGAAHKPFYTSMPTSFIMTAGNAYIATISRTDALDTTSTTYDGGTGNFSGPGLYLDGTSGTTARQIAKKTPGTSDVWASGGSGQWSINVGIKF